VRCGVDEAELLPNAEFMYVMSTILMGAMGYDSINVPSTSITSQFGVFLFLFLFCLCSHLFVLLLR
jgi:hypothetical protein